MLFDQVALEKDLGRVVESFKTRLKQVRTGRARADVFESIYVEAYGASTPLSGLASVSIDSATTVVIKPWDKNIITDVIKAITDSDLPYSPVVDGDKIRINIPPLTEETRKQVVKDMRELLENDYKVSVRQIRQRFMESVNKAEGVSEDEQERDRKAIQKQIDEMNAQLEQLADTKEEEIMAL